MQNKLSNIIIFSKPIQSGKTTALFHYIKNHKHVGGFLTPDVDGRRMLYDIAENTYHPFEITHATHHDAVQQIGKFNFLHTAFEKGKSILDQYNNEALIIIDEVGKLEIEKDIGFEPMVKRIIVDFKTKKFDGILLLVIRNTLLEKAIEKYGLQHATIMVDL